MKLARKIHFGLRLNQSERSALRKIAYYEGLSESAVLRRLIRSAYKELVMSEDSEYLILTSDEDRNEKK